MSSLSFEHFCHSALQKGSRALSRTAQLSKVSCDKEENKAGTSTAIADKKPKTISTPAKNAPQEGTKTMKTKPSSAKKVVQDGPKAGGFKIES